VLFFIFWYKIISRAGSRQREFGRRLKVVGKNRNLGGEMFTAIGSLLYHFVKVIQLIQLIHLDTGDTL
jgi:hypothetical protein